MLIICVRRSVSWRFITNDEIDRGLHLERLALKIKNIRLAFSHVLYEMKSTLITRRTFMNMASKVNYKWKAVLIFFTR